MNTYQILNRIGDVISGLTVLYKDVAQDLPQLTFADERPTAPDDVKKSPLTALPFLLSVRENMS
jgi:hypothetical protein